jgi:hypothetical protein
MTGGARPWGHVLLNALTDALVELPAPFGDIMVCMTGVRQRRVPLGPLQVHTGMSKPCKRGRNCVKASSVRSCGSSTTHLAGRHDIIPRARHPCTRHTGACNTTTKATCKNAHGQEKHRFTSESDDLVSASDKLEAMSVFVRVERQLPNACCPHMSTVDLCYTQRLACGVVILPVQLAKGLLQRLCQLRL